MIAVFILFALMALTSFAYGYILGTTDQREADARALAGLAREAAREIAEE